MKKALITSVVLVSLAVGFFSYKYEIKTVCFGDVCHQNGGTYIFYRQKLTEDECLKIGGEPVVGIGWVRVYAGCSPKFFK